MDVALAALLAAALTAVLAAVLLVPLLRRLGDTAVADAAAAAASAASAAAAATATAELERQLAAGDRVTSAREQALRAELGGMAQRLEHMHGVVSDLRADRAGQHGELLARITEAQRVTEHLRSTAEGLERALANPQARGQWGERMCDDVLRAAGLLEHVNYVKQRTLPDGTRPDVTFLLPDDRVLHMDVKFPLAGYLRFCDAADDRGRTEACAAFLRDVRNRVRELARPGYADERTVGFALLFIPNEAVYGFLCGNDPGLVDEALGQRVVLCSPFTLFAVLGVIRQAADAVAVARQADEVLDVLAGFTKQWEAFGARLDALGKQLGTVSTTFEQLNGTRRRQLERQLDRVADVRASRGLDDGGVAVELDEPVLREVSAW